MSFSPVLIEGMVIAACLIGALLGFLLTVVLFRASCDLCSVEPPRFLKSCLVVLLIQLVSAPIVGGVAFGFAYLGSALRQTGITVSLVGIPGIHRLADTVHLPNVSFLILSTLTSIGLIALVSGVLYIPLLRTRYLKGATISLIQSLLERLVSAVLLLVTVGGIVIVQGIIRLI
jgi:hypothetical protein